MPELASLHLCLGRLQISGSISWGSDDGEEQQPQVIGPCPPVDVPEIDDDDEALGFRA